MKLKKIFDANLKGKKVIIRVGFDCPLENGEVSDNFRITRGLESFKYLLENNAKKIVVISKLGRPKGYDESLSLKPIVREFVKFKEEIGYKGEVVLVEYDNDFGKVVERVNKIEEGIVFFENIRFWRGESKEDLEFAKKVSELGDIFVSDVFSAVHRTHPTITGLVNFLPSYAGVLVIEEVNSILQVTQNPKKPAIAIIGGAKLETKVPVIKSLVKIYDKVLVGGLIAVEVLDNIERFNQILSEDERSKLMLPTGFVDEERRDINEETSLFFSDIVSDAGTILWNGPMGKFEEKPFDKGSRVLANAIAKSDAYKLAGGGETSEMLKSLGVFDKIDFVSTGGGAMLDLISGKKLPGLEALKEK